MDKEEFEKKRDEIDSTLQHAERVWALTHGLQDPTVYSSRDLGILHTEVVEQTRDKGIIGNDIQRAIDKTQGSPPSKAKLFLARVLSDGFYSYLRLRKALGVPKDSFTITPSRGNRVPDCMSLINPGGLVTVKEGDYSIPTRVDVKTDVGLRGVGNATSFQAGTDDMTVVQTDSTKMCMIKDLQVDLNDKALIGISVKDSWLTNVRAKMINFKANSKGIHVNLATDLTGCYFNHNVIFIPDGEGRPGGSIAVHTETTGTATYTPNHNYFSGRIKEMDKGVYVEHGECQHFMNFDSSGCNYAYHIKTWGNIFTDCYEEESVTKGFYADGDAAAALILGGYFATAIEVAGAANVTRLSAAPGAESNLLTFHYLNPNKGPRISSVQQGNVVTHIRPDGTTWQFINADNKTRVSINTTDSPEIILLAGAGESIKLVLSCGTAGNRGVIRLYDVGAAAFKYAYLDNGVWVIADAEPT